MYKAIIQKLHSKYQCSLANNFLFILCEEHSEGTHHGIPTENPLIEEQDLRNHIFKQTKITLK